MEAMDFGSVHRHMTSFHRSGDPATYYGAYSSWNVATVEEVHRAEIDTIACCGPGGHLREPHYCMS